MRRPVENDEMIPPVLGEMSRYHRITEFLCSSNFWLQVSVILTSKKKAGNKTSGVRLFLCFF